MGRTTPNIGIYIPNAGETNYGIAFSAGMDRIDGHDHSGAPDGGVPIPSAGLADNSVTRSKLNLDVVLAGGGLSTSGGFPNALITDGVLNAIYNLGGTGIIAKLAGNTAATRTITGQANSITVTNGDGVAGNPTITLPLATSIAWVPSVQGDTIPGAVIYTTRDGWYVRLGTMVIAVGELAWISNSGTGDMLVTGFPFNFGSTSSVISTLSYADMVLPAGTKNLLLDGNLADNSANIIASLDSANRVDMTVQNTGQLYFTMIYFTP